MDTEYFRIVSQGVGGVWRGQYNKRKGRIKFMPTKPDYKRVSREFLDRVLDSPGVTYEPRGLFLCDQFIGGEQIWTAMRNLNGEGLTEDFRCKRTAVLWLHGHAFKDETYWRPDDMKEEADRLERLTGG